ncbi:MAG: DUF4386 family protein [Hamadaea sp.]|uniref:DUF4386 family protein n=1 Tax=Hamadaea sp. TaxID=2024425 RepID=UPI0017A134D0|nr:DUF4386 family protein [Hamadaea sp.]NUR72193.1 DUF4386 family protein [Hamadaea sp.]NUT18610.1 DUF4386 family protein [Hamadaea sp.]
MNIDASRGALRVAAAGGLGFDLLYVVHRLLQGFGPDDASPAGIAAYSAAHRGRLLGSEVALGLALFAFVGLIAGLTPVVRTAGQDVLATAVAVTGAVFVALGFLSQAAETALTNVSDPSAVLALNQLQGRTPNVWAITALTAVMSSAAWRTRLVPKWLAIAGFVAAGVFALGAFFSVFGREVEGNSSLFGVGLFVVWLFVVAVFLLRGSSEAREEQ